MVVKLINGDCLEKLKGIPDSSVDSVVTDPPYGLMFMGKKWDVDVPKVAVWKELLRVLKPGGHLLAFFGTRTYHHGAIRIENAGFEIRDQIQWIYGSGFPKSHNLKDEWQGWGTALKPANEPICVARKPLEKGLTVAENVLKWGTGALNIDGSRIGTESTKRPLGKSMSGVHIGSEERNSRPSMDKIGGSDSGRWPANVIFDEEAAAVLDEQSGLTKSPTGQVTGTKSSSGIMNGTGQKRSSNSGHGDSGGASRFFYVAKASKSERGQDNVHPTVKPIKLMQYLINLVTPPNGVVLDPFMGSGSTGVAAKSLDLSFIGIELDAEYYRIAEKRITAKIKKKE